MIGEKQKEFDLDSMQLLYYQAPLSAMLLVLPVLWCEPISALVSRTWASIELVCWKVSCILLLVQLRLTCSFITGRRRLFLFDRLCRQSLNLLDYWQHICLDVSFSKMSLNIMFRVQLVANRKPISSFLFSKVLILGYFLNSTI